jgi:ankyrin repeat protein
MGEQMKKLFIFLFFIGFYQAVAMEMPSKNGTKKEEEKIPSKPVPTLKEQIWRSTLIPQIINQLYPQLEEIDLETIQQYLQDRTGQLLLGEEWIDESVPAWVLTDIAVKLAYTFVLESKKFTVTQKQQIIDAVLSRGDVEENDRMMLNTFLHDAILGGVKRQNPNAVITAESIISDQTGNTMIHYATNSQFGAYFITVLLKHGAKVDAKNKAGITPLLSAITNQYKIAPTYVNEMVKLLLNAKAEVNVINNNGHTPIAAAIGGIYEGKTDLDTVKLLLAAEADLSIKYQAFYADISVLQIAVAQGDPALVKIMIDALKEKQLLQQFINAQDSGGITPLHAALIAFSFQYQTLNNALKEASIKKEEIQVRLQNLVENYKQIVQWLLDVGASWVIKNKIGVTAEDLVLQLPVSQKIKQEFLKLFLQKFISAKNSGKVVPFYAIVTA